ncbi:MAG TPA: hypothetical protein VJL87_06760, partial [Bdellovibrionota bacterium]|nr:hypothetical protein [Bdellovibrionota bacterium]
ATGFWTVMASGSWTGEKGGPLGTVPTHFGAWEKAELGWLDAEEISVAGGPFEYAVQLDRSGHRGLKPQGLKINLQKEVETIKVASAVDGESFIYSQKGDDLDNRLETKVDLKNVTEATLSFMTMFEIEDDFDYAYVEVLGEDGVFRSIAGSITRDTNPNGSNLGFGITGKSNGLVEAKFDLTPFVGREISLRFRYVTDGAAQELGFVVDKVVVNSGETVLFSDSFEDVSLPKWINSGFLALKGGTYTKEYERYYVVEWRTHYGYDRALGAAYNLHPALDGGHPKFADFFSMEPGLLVWYRNGKYASGENHPGKNPGEGFLLVVDAHPESMLDSEGKPLRTRVQLRDAAFGPKDLDPMTLTDPNGQSITVGNVNANAAFNDARSYYKESDPDNSVKTPTFGLRIAVENVSFDGSAVQLRVSAD